MATILEQILLVSSSTQRAASSSSFSSSYPLCESGSRGRDAFEWGASISALLLLVLNQTGRRSGLQASLLILSLLITFPTVLFKILRGEFGYWVAFLAVVSNFSFPHIIPVSRFLLFVVVPDWPTYELRESIVGGIICLLFAVLIVVTELHGIGESGTYRCNLHSLGYCSRAMHQYPKRGDSHFSLARPESYASITPKEERKTSRILSGMQTQIFIYPFRSTRCHSSHLSATTISSASLRYSPFPSAASI
ncbi:hypothetical protein Droror1_Dr00004732 [Drosera rotundifolia]